MIRCAAWCIRLVAAAVAVFGATPALAQAPIAPPALAACTSADQPVLPPRWHAVALMSPFKIGQLDVGEFVSDATVPAMRATVDGLELGAVDLLITDKDTYLLEGPHAAPTGCVSLGAKFKPPAKWLAPQAVCIGEAPVAKTDVSWWATPGAGEQATWYWYRKETGLPWRSVFLSPSPNPPVIGDYAMSYFPTFEPLQQTKLAQLSQFCAASARKADATVAQARTARDLMRIENKAAEAERATRIKALIPGFSHDACAGFKPVPWPDQFSMTAILTPQRFGQAPFSAIIYYDWPRSEAQVAGMYQGAPPQLTGVVMMKKGVGFWLGRQPDKGLACTADFPGMVRPTWKSAAFCECRGVLDHNPAIDPSGVIQILACPIKWQVNHVMWSWYRPDGAPLVFMEAAASAGGVMLADYERWLPGEVPPATFFDVPKQCVAGPSGGRLSDASCSDCHTTPQ